MEPENSIFSVEAFVLLKCLEYIKNNNTKFSLICTDSKSLTDALINKDILRSNYNILNAIY